MSRVRPIFSSFTTGELSPLMYGRVDFAKYPAGLRTLLNYVIRPHGPVSVRPGTRFVAEVKDSTRLTRLLPFEFSTTQAYQLEVGNGYIRFYKDGGRIQLSVTGAVNNGSGLVRITTPVAHTMLTGMRVVISGVLGTTEANGTWTITNVDATTFDLQGSVFASAYLSGGIVVPDIASPYTDVDLKLLKYIQSADTMYLFHPSYAMRKLVRKSHTHWVLSTVNLLPPPTYEAGFKPATTLTPSAVTGLGITLTAGSAVFEDTDVGRMVTAVDAGVNGNSARAIIRTVGVGPLATCTADVVDDFASTASLASQAWTIEGSPVSTLTPTVSQPAHSITTLNITARGWRSTDVGRYVRVNKGTARITKFVSATSVEAEILTVLANITASPGGAWSLEDPLWSSARGFPRAGALHEQRLVAGGNDANPQTFIGSNAGQYEVFGLGPDDDDAYEFAIAANQVNVIHWIVPATWLVLGTASTEFRAKGSDGALNAAISPNSVEVKASTFWGSSASVAPIRVGNAVLFVTRAGNELRELLFDVVRDSFEANNLLLLAEHLTDPLYSYTITDMAYQRRPDSTVWCVRSDGALLALTYQREHDVAGWSRHLTGPTMTRDDGVDAEHTALTTTIPNKGKFESVAVTPHWNGDRDVVFCVVNRTINGATKRYVEYLDSLSGFYGRLGTDATVLYSGPAAGTLSGLDHLEGESVAVLGNGAVYPNVVVTGGQVVLDAALPTVTAAEIGLGFSAVLETMAPEVPTQQGTSQGLAKHWNKIFVRLYKSMGLWVNGEEKPFRMPADAMDTRLPLFTGDKEHANIGRTRKGSILVEQRDPLPQTVVAIFGTLAAGESG